MDARDRLAAPALALALALAIVAVSSRIAGWTAPTRRARAAPRVLVPNRWEGTLPRAKLRAIVEYVEEHLDAGPTLEELAAVARLSPYYFARHFKRATGLPPYQYVIMRRVERTKQLLQARADLSLAEVAASAGFSDQSQFSHHFKRHVGVTPRQFRTPARIA